jgi:hypothetical protein
MSILDIARKVSARLKAQRNGHTKDLPASHPACEKSPPASWLADGLTVEDARTPFEPEPEREPGEEG